MQPHVLTLCLMASSIGVGDVDAAAMLEYGRRSAPSTPRRNIKVWRWVSVQCCGTAEINNNFERQMQERNRSSLSRPGLSELVLLRK